MIKSLHYGDNIELMKQLHAEHSGGFIDLIYIDPPFNSKRNYNVLFESIDLKDAKAQKEAFADTWSSVSYHETLAEIQKIDLDLYKFLQALDSINISKSAISYLTTMSIRIWYMHKLLKETGSFYLHCDPNMSHYLKLVCDIIFGEKNFRNEIIWKRTNAHNDTKRATSFGAIHDVIFYYSKSKTFVWNKQFTNYDEKYIQKAYNRNDETGYFKTSDITANNPGYHYSWKGILPSKGRFWAYSELRMQELEDNNKLYYSSTGKPYLKNYFLEMDGIILQDVWNDISPISPQAKERLGYPTQKPEALMERLIKASTNEGDLVADFFCGCGTTIAVAEKLNRNWIGCDISHLAVKLILSRLSKPYQHDKERSEYLKSITITGLPKDIASAKELARNADKHRVQFQDWVIEYLLDGNSNTKKSGDGGFDGYITFPSVNPKKRGHAIIEVKSGNVGIATLRSFMNVVDKQKADIGIFVCFAEQITKGMFLEASSKGSTDEFSNCPKIQIISVEDLLADKKPKLPGHSDFYNSSVYEKAETSAKTKKEIDNQEKLYENS